MPRSKNFFRVFIRLRVIVFAAILVVLVVLVACVFRHVGGWLLITDPIPERLDAICTFAGENVRVRYSKELTLAFCSAEWFLSDYKDGHGRILQENDFDMSRVYVTDTCTSTISEVTAMDGWIELLRRRHDSLGAVQPLQVGLVSSPYHMRRISIMVHRRFSVDRVHLHYLAVPFKHYPWNRETFRYWWRNDETVELTIRELIKLVYFFLTGYIK